MEDLLDCRKPVKDFDYHPYCRSHCGALWQSHACQEGRLLTAFQQSLWGFVAVTCLSGRSTVDRIPAVIAELCDQQMTVNKTNC